MRLAYYPGCSAKGSSADYEMSTQAVCGALGMRLEELPDWNCCGSTPAHAVDTELSAALCVRNLDIAARTQADMVVTPCPSCLANLKLARHRMQDAAFKARVDALLDSPTVENAEALPETYSVLQIILEQIGPEAIRARVTRPLEGVKIATYYGCLMSRPADVMQFDDPENPTAMDKIMEALGAEVVDFPLKTECCGAAMGVARQDVTGSLSRRILATARSFGADAVVTACPLCHMNLDLRQGQAERQMRLKFRLPVFYYTQLMGLAFGLPDETLKLDKLAVDPAPFLQLVARRRKARIDAAAEAARAAMEKAESEEGAAS